MKSTVPMIQFHNFSKIYGKIIAVKNLDLDIKQGETFALIGPNGSGKSTLIRAIAGLIQPTSGEISIRGINYNDRKNHLSKKIYSYMPQRVSMPEQLTGVEVLQFFASLRGVGKESIDDVLETVNLNADAGRRTREYSGGMLQRLGLAVALLETPLLMLLDEPTLNLDPVGVKRFRTKMIEMKNDGTTIVFSSHILQDAIYLADRVGTIINGELTNVESISDFNRRISNEISVKVMLDNTSEAIVKAAIDAGALAPRWNGGYIQFRAAPGNRLDVIRAIENAGGNIREFHTEIPGWEVIKKEKKRGV